MYPEFEQWLSVRVTEAQQAVIMDAFEVLSELLDLRVWDTAVNILSQSERLDTLTCLSDLQSEIRDYSIAAALEYGITLNPEHYGLEQQPLINKLLTTLLQVDRWEDSERILAICESDESSEEILAALCEELLAVEPEALLPLIDYVDSSKIDALKALYRKRLQKDGEETPQWHRKALVVANQYQGTAVADWLLEGGTLELGFDYYLNTFLSSFISSKDAALHAKNWIMMSLASGVSESDVIYTHCVSYFDEVYQNLELQSKVAKAIKYELNALGGLNRESL